MIQSQHPSSSFLPHLVCFLAGLFYLYEFVLQVSPSVITHEIMHDLNLSAAGLGIISSFYFYAYTPMQFPAGLLYDRLGPRLLITVAVLICAAGAFLFSIATSVFFASAGRFLMGIGSAFAFIGALVLISRWYPAKYFAFLTGIIQLMSSVGAIAGQGPLAYTVSLIGWRHTFLYLAMIGLILAVLIASFVRDQPKGSSNARPIVKPALWESLKAVCGKSQTWVIAIYAFTSWAPITAFAAIWGVPYLAETYHISITQAASACSMIWIGIGVGSPLIGWWSDRIEQRRLPLMIASGLGIISLVSLLYIPALPPSVLWLMLFIFGLAASGQSLSFGVVADMNEPHVVGTAIGLNNMAVVIGGALFQPLVGILLDYMWSGKLADHIPIYTSYHYRIAMTILPLCYILGFFISTFKLRETHARAKIS